jgi:putative nucleotidyltransferase with HDIG domain
LRSFFWDLEARSRVYAGSLAAAALLTWLALLASGEQLPEPWIVLGLATVAAAAERGSVRLSKSVEGSISTLPILFAAVLFGPLAAGLVGAASMLGDLRAPHSRFFAYTGSRAITGAVAGLMAQAAAPLGQSTLASIAYSTLAGAIAGETLDLAFVLLARRVRAIDNAGMVRSHAPILALSATLYAPLVALLVFLYLEISPWTLPLFLFPALAAQRLFSLYQDQRQLTEDVLSANERLERANLSFATALVATLEARDRYTAGHSASVAAYARDIAARLGLSEVEVNLAHLCGLVHDIGKIGLPAGLLEKDGPLSLDERRRMEDHSAIGEHILSKVEDYAEIARVVRHHHERVDGLGYPDGLKRDDIPLVARIIAVADAYDAMTSDRPYRDAMPSRVARLRLAQAVESQFDTSVVAAFEAILTGADEAYRSGGRSRARTETTHRIGTAEAALAV